jgi:hypothetical protein
MTLKPLQPLQPQLLPRRTSTQSTCCRKEEPKIPSQDSIDLFSIETSSVPKFRVQFSPIVNRSPRQLPGKIDRNRSPFQSTRYHRVNFHRSGIWSKRHVCALTISTQTGISTVVSNTRTLWRYPERLVYLRRQGKQ